ncbi:MAG: hypothetical protein RIS53_946 [Bacillota bacterium]|jgi:DNA-binding PucR family transcriptional regulator
MKTGICYYLTAQSPFPDEPFRATIKDVLGQSITWQRIHKDQVAFFSQQESRTNLQTFLDTYQQEYNLKFHLLKTYRLHALGENASRMAIRKNPGKVDSLGDFILQLIFDGNQALMPLIKEEYSQVPRHLMQTASMLLACDLKATLASERLYIHRNTFAYRLNQFVNLTGLDIRQHDHALLFTLIEKLLIKLG